MSFSIQSRSFPVGMALSEMMRQVLVRFWCEGLRNCVQYDEVCERDQGEGGLCGVALDSEAFQRLIQAPDGRSR